MTPADRLHCHACEDEVYVKLDAGGVVRCAKCGSEIVAGESLAPVEEEG